MFSSVKKFIVLLFLFPFLTTSSVWAKDSLVESVAKLMNVKTDQITLKKQGRSCSSPQVYSFEVDGKKYLVKTFGKRQNAESRKREIGATKIFSDLGLGTRLVAVGDDNSFYIREYIAGRTLRSKDFQDDSILKAVATSLKKLHGYKSEVTAESLLEQTKKHCDRITKKKIATPSGFDKSYEEFQSALKSRGMVNGFCHNNLNPHNMLLADNGKIYFINLGRIGNSNIYDELAYVTLFSGISGEKFNEFLKVYYDRSPTRAEVDSIKQAQKLVCFASAATYFDFSESKEDKDTYLKSKVKGLDDMLKSKNLESFSTLVTGDKVPGLRTRDKNAIKQCALALYTKYLKD